MSKPDPQLVRRIGATWRGGDSAERRNLIYDITRHVSKLGELSILDAELRAMQTFFRAEDAVELYTKIRDDSMRFESEWREQFVSYFSAFESALPRIQMTEEQYDEWLREQGADI